MSEDIISDAASDNETPRPTIDGSSMPPSVVSTDPTQSNKKKISFIDTFAPFIFIGSVITVLVIGFLIYTIVSSTNTEQTELPMQSDQQFKSPTSTPKITLPDNGTNTQLIDDVGSTPNPTPTPDEGPGPFACDPKGICNNYGNPLEGIGQCPRSFADPTCLGICDDISIRCIN